MRLSAIALAVILLSGCILPRPPVTSNVTSDIVKIRVDSRYTVDMAAVQAEADRGCRMSNKQPKFIRQDCTVVDELHFCIVQEFLYYCE